MSQSKVPLRVWRGPESPVFFSQVRQELLAFASFLEKVGVK
jgi:hypothetical protein